MAYFKSQGKDYTKNRKSSKSAVRYSPYEQVENDASLSSEDSTLEDDDEDDCTVSSMNPMQNPLSPQVSNLDILYLI